MINRRIHDILLERLDESPAVALLGPRQVGKTTLAQEIGESGPSLYLDLESDADRSRLREPELYLGNHEDKLVILDEDHRVPDLFQNLRGLIDKGRKGKENGPVPPVRISISGPDAPVGRKSGGPHLLSGNAAT